jgi:hypothetical protein
MAAFETGRDTLNLDIWTKGLYQNIRQRPKDSVFSMGIIDTSDSFVSIEQRKPTFDLFKILKVADSKGSEADLSRPSENSSSEESLSPKGSPRSASGGLFKMFSDLHKTPRSSNSPPPKSRDNGARQQSDLASSNPGHSKNNLLFRDLQIPSPSKPHDRAAPSTPCVSSKYGQVKNVIVGTGATAQVK